MKTLLRLALFLSFCSPIFGQTSSITATISDSDGTPWVSGSYQITLVPSQAGTATRIDNGQNVSPTSFSGTMDGSGSLAVTLVSASNINPKGSTWRFQICPNVFGATCGTTNIPVNASGSYSSQLNAVITAPRISGGQGAYAYADIEVTATTNNTYWNVTSQACRYYGSSWGACGSGGGGPPSGAASNALTGTYPGPQLANATAGAAAVGNGTGISPVTNSLWCSGFSALGGNTACDESWIAALGIYSSGGSAVTSPTVSFEIPPGINAINSQILGPLPTGSNRVPSLALNGQGSGAYGNNSTLRATSVISGPVLSLPPVPTTTGLATTHWGNTHLGYVTLDANGYAASGFDLAAQYFPTIEDVSVLGATGTSAWATLGDLPTGSGGTCNNSLYSCGALNNITSNLYIFNNAMAPSAQVTPNVVGGSITSYTISNGGKFRPRPVNGTATCTTVPVYFKTPGMYAGNPPSGGIWPTGTVGNLQLDTSPADGFCNLASITQTTNGSGLTGSAYVVVPDQPLANFGLNYFSTDSSVRDYQDNSVGTIAGISDRVSGATEFDHAHIWNAYGGVQNWGQDYYSYPELDSLFAYGFNFNYGANTVLNAPQRVYVATPSGTSAYDYYADFYTSYGTTNVTIANGTCTDVNPNTGYAEFAGPTGAIDPFGYGPYSASAVAAALPNPNSVYNAFTVINTPPCSAAPTYASNVVVASAPNWSTDPKREWHFEAVNLNASTITTPFLIAELYPFTASSGSRSGLRLTVTGGAYSVDSATQIIGLKNGSIFYYDSPVIIGDSTQLSAAYIQAYKLSGGQINVYAWLGGYGDITIKGDQVLDSDTHWETQPQQIAVPGGATLVYDSSNLTTYPLTSAKLGPEIITSTGNVTPLALIGNTTTAMLPIVNSGTGDTIDFSSAGSSGPNIANGGTEAYFPEYSAPAGDNLELVAPTGQSGYLGVHGTGLEWDWNTAGLYPATDNTYAFGSSSFAPSGIWGHAITDLGLASGSASPVCATTAGLLAITGCPSYATTGANTFSAAQTAPAFFPQSLANGPYTSPSDDFYNVVNIVNGSIGTASGASCSESGNVEDQNHPGNFAAISGTGGSGTGTYCVYGSVASIVTPNSTLGWTWESAVYPGTLPLSQVGAFQAGLASGQGANPWITGVGFYLSSANTGFTSANDWGCIYGTTPTITDSGVLATVAWHRLTMINDGTDLHWYIDGTQVCGTGVALAGIPSTTAFPSWTSTALSGTSVRIYVDYLSFQRAVAR